LIQRQRKFLYLDWLMADDAGDKNKRLRFRLRLRLRKDFKKGGSNEIKDHPHYSRKPDV